MRVGDAELRLRTKTGSHPLVYRAYVGVAYVGEVRQARSGGGWLAIRPDRRARAATTVDKAVAYLTTNQQKEEQS